MFFELPTTRPATPLLDQLNEPKQLSALSVDQLTELAIELRHFLLYSVGQTGGHFGAGLGVVELTIALHYCLNTPDDHLIWDVGHQSYPHKILTGRRESLLTIRKKDGLAPFPRQSESPYDAFGTGHSSTSISAALGMALADKLQNIDSHTVAVIGDGAMTAGMAFEALNHAAHTGSNLLVILNDNDMSISHNEGGLATYLAKNLKDNMGETTAALFEALDFNYSGPIDGHNLPTLITALQHSLDQPGPQFLHITTLKGKGFAPAEKDPVGYHAIAKIEPLDKPKAKGKPTFASVFGQWATHKAAQDSRLTAITPAMREGSGLVQFSQQFPDRFFDVAIAEQHAVTLAAGMAFRHMKPVVAIYSTFLQRAYDQLIHDVLIQDLDVLFCIDRAGLVGEDGATHAGCYDISYLRCIPEMIVMTPSDEQELLNLLETGYQYKGPAAIRYPRGSGTGKSTASATPLKIGVSREIRRGNSGIAVLNFGPLLSQAEALSEEVDISILDMRFVKPLDQQIISELLNEHHTLITLEDHAVQGGAGSAVSEYLHSINSSVRLISLGIPDRWIEHATRQEQLEECGIDSKGLRRAILPLL